MKNLFLSAGLVASLMVVTVLTAVSAVIVVTIELETSDELPEYMPAKSFIAASGMFTAIRVTNALAPMEYLSSMVCN